MVPRVHNSLLWTLDGTKKDSCVQLQAMNSPILYAMYFVPSAGTLTVLVKNFLNVTNFADETSLSTMQSLNLLLLCFY